MPESESGSCDSYRSDEDQRFIDDGRPGLKRVGVSAFMYLVLQFLCIGMSFGPTQSLFLDRECAKVGLSHDRCKDKIDGVKVENYDTAQSHASAVILGWSLACGVGQLLVCPLLGMIGDASGRKIPLVIPQIGGALSSMAVFIIPAARQNDLLMAAAALASLLGGQYTCCHAAFSSLADVTQKADAKTRASVFGAVEIGLWVGLVAGPAAGGMVAEQYGNRFAFLILACVYALNGALALFTYPETLEVARRVPVDWWRANPFTSLKMFKEGGRTTSLLGLTALCALTGTTGGSLIVGLYAAKWADVSTNKSTWIVSVLALSGCVGLLLGMPRLAKHLPLQKVLGLSLLNIAVCWFATSFMTSFWTLILVSALQVLSASFAPIVRVGVVNTFGSNRYGEALAAVGSMEQLCYILASQFATGIYSCSEHTVLRIAGSVGIHTLAFPAIAVVAFFGAWASFSIVEMPVKEVDAPLDSVTQTTKSQKTTFDAETVHTHQGVYDVDGSRAPSPTPTGDIVRGSSPPSVMP